MLEFSWFDFYFLGMKKQEYVPSHEGVASKLNWEIEQQLEFTDYDISR